MTKEKLVEKIKELLKTDIDLDFLLMRKNWRGWLLVLEIGLIRWVAEIWGKGEGDNENLTNNGKF